MSKHVFDIEKDAENLAMDIVTYLKKWGMFQDVQIFTGGKCYRDDHGELVIRDEPHPEKYTEGYVGRGYEGEAKWDDFSNPERLLDMTFEGALYLLLSYHHYEVKIGDLAEEVKRLIVPETEKFQEESAELAEEYLEGRTGWDPSEYDSYEEWLELHQYCDLEEFQVKGGGERKEFSSRQEYKDFLMQVAVEREYRIMEYFDDDTYDATDWDKEVFYDTGEIMNRVLDEFSDLLEKYGLWYDLCFEWSLTTYRV